MTTSTQPEPDAADQSLYEDACAERIMREIDLQAGPCPFEGAAAWNPTDGWFPTDDLPF